jgi:hypothetical protein
MKLGSKLSFYFLPICLAVLAVPVRAANVIPDFNTPGADGSPVTFFANSFVSAAANWGTFLCNPSAYGTSAIAPTTDPGGSGMMMEFTTNAGFYSACGNGLFADLTSGLPLDSTGTFDINVAPGTSGEIGFVNTAGAFDLGSYMFSPTGGSWVTVSFSNIQSVTGEVGFEIFDATGGTIYLSNGIAPTPEPATIALMLSGALALFGKIRFGKKRNSQPS